MKVVPSKLKWMRAYEKIDLDDMICVCSKYRGYLCDVKYTEGFKPCNVYPRYSTKNLLKTDSKQVNMCYRMQKVWK